MLRKPSCASAIPSSGAAGPLAGAIGGLGVGAAAGGVIGLLKDHGVSEDEADLFAAIKNGAAGIGYRGFEGLKGQKPEPAVLAELKKINEAITVHAAELITDPNKADEVLK